MDTAVWGRPTWDIMLLVAHVADNARGKHPELRAKCEEWFACYTQTMCCEPCRLFYSQCWIFLQKYSTQVPEPSLVRWLVVTRDIIEAKIAKCTTVCCKNYYQLLKRIHLAGHSLANSQICVQICLQAVRLHMIMSGDRSAVMHATLRAEALLYQIGLLAEILRSARPSLSAHLREALRALHDHPEKWATAFSVAYYALERCEDASPPGVAELWDRLSGAKDKLVVWADAHYFHSLE